MLVSENTVRLIGNLARAPECGVTRSGVVVANLVVVAVSSWYDAEGVEHEESTFIPVECFGTTAEWAGRELASGMGVMIRGRLKNVSWGQEPQKKSKMLVSADLILRIFGT